MEVLLEKKFGVVVNIDGKTNDQPRAAASRVDRQAERDSMREARNDRKSSSTNFIFDVGLNALVNNHIDRVTPAGQVPTSPLDLRTAARATSISASISSSGWARGAARST